MASGSRIESEERGRSKRHSLRRIGMSSASGRRRGSFDGNFNEGHRELRIWKCGRRRAREPQARRKCRSEIKIDKDLESIQRRASPSTISSEIGFPLARGRRSLIRSRTPVRAHPEGGRQSQWDVNQRARYKRPADGTSRTRNRDEMRPSEAKIKITSRV